MRKTIPPRLNRLAILAVVVTGLGLLGIWFVQSRNNTNANTAVTTSCNAVSTLSEVSINETASAASGKVVIQYTLTNTIDTKLNCSLLATVKNADGVQVGTWRRSFLDGTPGTHQEQHELENIPYTPGVVLELTITAADENSTFVD
jgi:hypothetical protein